MLGLSRVKLSNSSDDGRWCSMSEGMCGNDHGALRPLSFHLISRLRSEVGETAVIFWDESNRLLRVDADERFDRVRRNESNSMRGR